MIDDDIRKLIEQDSAADLGSLEADVWRREEALRAGRRTTRHVATTRSSAPASCSTSSGGQPRCP